MLPPVYRPKSNYVSPEEFLREVIQPDDIGSRLTKPPVAPPPPPKFHGGRGLVRTPERYTIRQSAGYPLPMRGGVPAWRRVLSACRYPATVIMLDFETYFDGEYTMRNSSTVEYIHDARFEILGMSRLLVPEGVNYPNYEGDVNFECRESATSYLRYLREEYRTDLADCTIVAQNAKFDMSILAFRFGIYPRYVIDTLGLARAWNSRQNHGLDELSKQWNLPPKGDTAEFSGVTMRAGRFTKPKGRGKAKLPIEVPIATEDQIVSLGSYANNDVSRQWEIFTLLLPRLSRPTVELPIMQHTLEMYTKPMMRVDEERGRSITSRMEEEIDKAIEPTGLTRELVSKDSIFELALSASLEAAGDDPEQYKKQTARPIAAVNGGGFKRAFALAKTDPEREILSNHPHGNVRLLMAARGAIDSWPNHISRVNRFINQSKANGGLLSNPLKYHGAHTGRDSGDEKLNTQNLGSRGHPLVSEVRTILMAPPGHKLVIVDEAQVEARGLAWIAGQWDLVKKFENNEEIYCGLASKILGFPVRKPRKSGGIAAIEDKMKRGRNLGKVAVLGMGYGMGKDRAFEYANGSPNFCDIDYATAIKLVTVYREDNQEIVRFWKDVERAFVYTAKFGTACEMPRGLRFEKTEDCDLILTLPSGRELHYHRLKVVRGTYGDVAEVYNAREHHWEHLWGGVLTENIVQAFCRDLLMEAMLRMANRGFRCVHRVHDELIFCVPEDRAEECLNAAIQEMSTRPSWAPELPLGAEGTVSDRYGQH